jgi:transposase-like protein
MADRNDGKRKFTPEQKVRIVKEVLTTDIGVSGACRKYGITSGLFYKWQEKFFEGAVGGFKHGLSGVSSREQRQLEDLKHENTRMKDVIAEITAENIDFKKKLGA